MKRVLEFLVRYLDFVYLDPTSRFVDSRTMGYAEVNAWIAIETERLRWVIHADRDQVRLNVGPRSTGDTRSTYHIGLIKQLFDGGHEVDPLLDDRSAAWVRDNLDRITALFADESIIRATSDELEGLKMRNVEARGWTSKIRQT